jgi:hypothetical protein
MTHPLELADSPEPGLSHECEVRRVYRLLFYWRSLRAIEGVPVFVDFDPRRNPLHWSQCFLLAMVNGAAYVFDHFGVSLFPLVGAVPARPNEVPEDTVVGRLLSGIPWVTGRGQPWKVEGVDRAGNATVYHRSVLIPFRDVGHRLAYLLGGVTFRIDR